MALKKTQLLDITSVTGISTVGIFTAGVTQLLVELVLHRRHLLKMS